MRSSRIKGTPAPVSSGLFGTGERSDRSPKRAAETHFEFLDRVDQPFYAKVRELLDAWLAQYPDGPGKKDLVGRLRSDDWTHRSAYWELWLHSFLTRSGLEVEIHPDCPDGRRRDYKVTGDGGSFYLEAYCQFGDKVKRGQSRRLAEFRERLEAALTLRRHGILLHVGGVGTDALSHHPYANKLTEAAQRIGAGEQASVFTDHTADGWDLEGHLIGLALNSPDLPMTSVAITHGFAGSLGALHIAPLRKAIAKKAREASGLNLPYVIAANLCNPEHFLIRPVDLYQALMGTESLVLHGSGRSEYRANGDGSFMAGGQPSTTAVSAVIVAQDMAPEWAASYLPTLYRHPAPARPLVQTLPLPIGRLDDAPGTSPEVIDAGPPAWQIFGLSPTWPNYEPFEKRYW